MISASWSSLREPQKSRTPRFQEGLNISEPGWRRLQWETHGHAKSLLGGQVMEFLCLPEPAALILCRVAPLGNSDSLSLLIAFPTFTHNISFFFNLFFYWRIIALQNFVVFLKHPCVHRFCFLSRSACSWLLTASALLQSLLLLHKLNSSHCKLPLLSVFLNSNSWKLDGWS